MKIQFFKPEIAAGAAECRETRTLSYALESLLDALCDRSLRWIMGCSGQDYVSSQRQHRKTDKICTANSGCTISWLDSLRMIPPIRLYPQETTLSGRGQWDDQDGHLLVKIDKIYREGVCFYLAGNRRWM